MKNEDDRPMDDDPVVDFGVTNNEVAETSQIHLEIQSSIPKNLKMNKDFNNVDEPKTNFQRHLLDDSDDELPPKEGLKLEKIQQNSDDGSDGASVQRATTLNPQTLSNLNLNFVSDSPQKQIKIGSSNKEGAPSQHLAAPSSPANKKERKQSASSTCYFDDDVKKTQSQIVSPNKANQLVRQAKQKKQQDEEEEQRQLALYERCKKATQERVKKFSFGFHPSVTANQRYVNIEGPDPVLDFSFFAVNMDSDFRDMERGLSIIPPYLFNKKYGGKSVSQKDFNNSKSGSISFLINPNESNYQWDHPMEDESTDTQQSVTISQYFSNLVDERLQDLRAEFIILQKITFHEDHARHLIYLKLSEDPTAAETIVCQIDEIQHQNRHMTCLPYYHSQVKLKPIEEHIKQKRNNNTYNNNNTADKVAVADSATQSLHLKQQCVSQSIPASSHPVTIPKDAPNRISDHTVDANKTSMGVLAQSQSPPELKYPKDESKVIQQNYIDAYINANYISGMIRNFSERSMIAAMAPTEKTVCKFWQMIWQNDVNLIIMLCPFIKDEKQKDQSREESVNYWNQDMHCHKLEQVGQITMIYDNNKQEIFELKLLEINEVRPNIFHRKIQLDLKYKLKEEDNSQNPFQNEDIQSPFFGQNDQFESHIVDHIHHVGWIDDTAPQCEWLFEDIDFLVEMMDKSRKLKERIEEVANSSNVNPFDSQEKPQAQKVANASPVLIHCSAGIGRTGTLVAIYNIIESLQYSMNVNNYNYIQKTQNNEWVEHKRNKPNFDKVVHQSLCPLRVSVFGCIRKIREQRMNMVKTKDQYAFVYRYVQRWVTKNEQALTELFK